MTKLLVTGASGQLGRAVIANLLAQDGVTAGQIVAASRNPAKLADLADQGVETRAADFDDPASLEQAFAGVDRLLLISTDELAVPGKRLAQHKAAVAAAVKAGVKHILYTSMPNPDKSLISFAPDHLGTEDAIKASGLGYTILRNSWYTDNHFMGLPHALEVGNWYTSQAGGRLPNISRADCAVAAAAALVSPPAGNTILTLTGSEALTAEDIAAIVSKITGKPLNVVQVSDDQLAGGVRGSGMPEFVVQLVVTADANIRAGNFDIVTSDFETLTGRKPQTVADFFAAHKAALG